MFERLSAFVTRASYEDMSAEARRQMKIRLLDWLACALGATQAEPMVRLRDQVEKSGGRPMATLIGGGKTSPGMAALYNRALGRYLGFNDSFMTKKGSCHPSDSLSAVLAASEYRRASGRDFLTALGVAYQVHYRLCEVYGGSGHGTIASYAVAAGVAKALNLNPYQTAKAIAATAAANGLSQGARGKSVSRSNAALHPDSPFSMDQALLLAMSYTDSQGDTFEADERLSEALAPGLEIDWHQENLEAVRHTAIKRFNTADYLQSAVEAILYLRERQPCHPDQIERIELDTFEEAYDLFGITAQGAEYKVRTAEQAYYSVPYVLAVALLDGEVCPPQYERGRVLRDDVQKLLNKVAVRTDPEFSRCFPQEVPARVQIFLRDGQVLTKQKRDYEGYPTRPLSWVKAVEKFKNLTRFHTDYETRERVIRAVLEIEDLRVSELTYVLGGPVKASKVTAHEKVFSFGQHQPAA